MYRGKRKSNHRSFPSSIKGFLRKDLQGPREIHRLPSILRHRLRPLLPDQAPDLVQLQPEPLPLPDPDDQLLQEHQARDTARQGERPDPASRRRSLRLRFLSAEGRGVQGKTRARERAMAFPKSIIRRWMCVQGSLSPPFFLHPHSITHTYIIMHISRLPSILTWTSRSWPCLTSTSAPGSSLSSL